MLRVLQKSCDQHQLDHVVLTDHETLNRQFEAFGEMRYFAGSGVPEPLMQAMTELHARWLEKTPVGPAAHTLFVGADAIMRRNPRGLMPAEADLCVTLRPGHPRYPINNGFMFVRSEARERVAQVFRAVADRCGPKWGDDQRTIANVLGPMPARHTQGVARAGVRVAFLPMVPFNTVPRSFEDPAPGAVVLHFRGKARKTLMLDWAKRHL